MNTNNNTSYYIHTLGCKVNQYDSYHIQELLNAAGFSPASNEENADVIIINTCTVTNTADKKSRSLIRGAHKSNPRAKIIVCGCMATVEADKLMPIGKIDAVISNAKREKIAEILKGCIINNAKAAVCDDHRLTAEETHGTIKERTRRYIKIQDGCDNGCAYCIIPMARGASVSRSAASIIEEIKSLSDSGINEFVLTGIHICSYKYEQYDLLRLLQTVSDETGSVRFRLGSLDPRFISDDWIAKASELQKLCPHFHISLQSGSNNILKKMGRGHTADYYRRLIYRIRELWDYPAITTDIITGFPGESDSDFFETMEFIKQNRFARVHVFPYSERAGTSAAAMVGRIPVSIRKERAARLIDVVRVLELEYLDSCAGKADDVIFETQDGKFAVGHTSRYVKARAIGVKPGEFKKVLLTQRTDDVLECKIIC